MDPTPLVKSVNMHSICVPATLSRFPSLVQRTLARFKRKSIPCLFLPCSQVLSRSITTVWSLFGRLIPTPSINFRVYHDQKYLFPILLLNGCAQTAEYDVVIRNGTIYDGSGSTPFVCAVDFQEGMRLQVIHPHRNWMMMEQESKGLPARLRWGKHPPESFLGFHGSSPSVLNCSAISPDLPAICS